MCKKLNSKIIENNLLLRFHSRKFGWDEDKMFIKNLGNIKIDMGYTKISKLISSAKLVLHTYIGTGYLETLASNIPTVIFANTKECLLNKETLIDLNILKEANIYHEDHTSAANFINSNWNTISSWWFSDSTQNARKHFCLKYSKVPSGLISSPLSNSSISSPDTDRTGMVKVSLIKNVPYSIKLFKICALALTVVAFTTVVALMSIGFVYKFSS